MKTIHYYFAVVSLLFGLSACTGLPDYANVPKISFNSFVITRNIVNPLSLDKRDSINTLINFEDGDGDLGIAVENLNTSEENIILSIEKKANGVFSPLVLMDTTLNFNGRFPDLSPSTDNRPIDGVLNYAIVIPHSAISSNDTLRFNIYIIDQAGNKSNGITTNEVIVKKL